jgi:polyhydroxyalkanoate synthase
MGSAAQFMQAGQNMMQQFMDYLGKAGGSAGSASPPADPQALTALQKQFMDQQMSLVAVGAGKQQGQEPAFKVTPNPVIAASRRPSGAKARSTTTCIRPIC